MSDAPDRVRDLKRAGFGFLAHRDAPGESITLQATRVRAGHIETVLIHDEHDALAARCRDEPRAAVVWHRAGATADVIAELLGLPAPGSRGAPSLGHRPPSELCSRRSTADDDRGSPRGEARHRASTINIEKLVEAGLLVEVFPTGGQRRFLADEIVRVGATYRRPGSVPLDRCSPL